VTYDFTLSKAAPMTGSIFGSDGKPLAGAEVYLATNLFVVNNGKPSSWSLGNARIARTDAAGRFELPPEAEPFYLVVLDDQGYAVVNEKQFAGSTAIHIKPWTAENRSFRAERRPSTGSGEAPAADAKNALTVRVVDQEGKPGDNPNQFTPYESGWSYSPNILSDRDGMARVADPYNRCVIARHVERKLVAVRSINPEQMNGTDVVTLTMQPQCAVSGRLTAKEMEARNRKIAWSNVYVNLDDGIGRPMSCSSKKADYHFYLPPGTYTLYVYATDTQHVRKTITVKPNQQELEVEPIDLPPTGLVLLEGKPAPELRDILAWKNGGPVKLSDLRGKVVVLALSSGWDGRGSIMPELFPFYDKYHDQGLVVIEIRLDMGLASDSEAQLKEKLAAVQMPFFKDYDVPIPRAAVQTPTLKNRNVPIPWAPVRTPTLDRDVPIPIAFVHMNRVPRKLDGKVDGKAKTPCAILEDYGVNGVPTGVLIDRQGRVVGRFDPRSERKDAALDAVLEKVLKVK
jgi:glutathione peroxidase-family protein